MREVAFRGFFVILFHRISADHFSKKKNVFENCETPLLSILHNVERLTLFLLLSQMYRRKQHTIKEVMENVKDMAESLEKDMVHCFNFLKMYTSLYSHSQKSFSAGPPVCLGRRAGDSRAGRQCS
jgi:hypothetical protein